MHITSTAPAGDASGGYPTPRTDTDPPPPRLRTGNGAPADRPASRSSDWSEGGRGGRSLKRQDPLGAPHSPDRAPVWDAIWLQRGLVSRLIAAAREGMHALHRGVLLRHLHPDASVLELGCGPATLTLSVAPRIRSLVGLDISPEALRQATANARVLGIMNATFLEGDCRAVPFTDTFTVVWSAGLIEHFFEHDIDVVQEHLRAASPGGVAIISVPATFSAHHLHYLLTRPRLLRWLWPWSNLRHFQRFYTPWQLRRLGQATGFPFHVFYLPPAPLGFLLGILVLEIHKGVPGGRSPRTS